ncbi:hypothetical protein BDY19DRAFT_1049559 [Irpex rosettiformis]|uniref:Uncharacterized protein n=1 Tax=Irpex rosettiformis TaxID=378272 RepID=A0ACB8TZ14_9APHY|nr:hypothetical protein BDY19DRAFT_1049559 [Irpex rosettiformis]
MSKLSYTLRDRSECFEADTAARWTLQQKHQQKQLPPGEIAQEFRRATIARVPKRAFDFSLQLPKQFFQRSTAQRLTANQTHILPLWRGGVGDAGYKRLNTLSTAMNISQMFVKFKGKVRRQSSRIISEWMSEFAFPSRLRPSRLRKLRFEGWGCAGSRRTMRYAESQEGAAEILAPYDGWHQTKAGNIQFNTVSHGTSGPIHVTYPGFIPGIVGDWTDSLANLSIPTTVDAYAGDDSCGFIATSSINPSNWTRSYARSAYIDPLPPRSNLAILANATVT